MKVLVIGSGGREHCLVWKLSQSREVDRIFCAPGNAGISEIAECIDILPSEAERLVNFAQQEEIGLTVVGPEAPLVEGIVDEFTRRGLKIFGPSKQCARLEGSKVFAKTLMRKYGIPTPEFIVFEEYESALLYLRKRDFPCVIKADGLAAGKGSIVVHSLAEGEKVITQMMQEKIFGKAGERVVIEEYIEGEEASIIALTDGKTILILPPVQDHKQVFEGNKGANTGGMGAYSPLASIDENKLRFIKKRILERILEGLKKEGLRYKGALYAGIIMDGEDIKVLEFNVRFGDPETQVLLPRLKNDLFQILLAVVEERLEEIKIEIDPRPAVCVVLASKGYPGKYERDKEIFGLDKIEDVLVFHAGTKLLSSPRRIVSDGGRVLGITGLGNSLEEARDKVYRQIEKVYFEGMHYRKDIGRRKQ